MTPARPLLAVALVLPFFGACGEDAPTDETNTAPSEVHADWGRLEEKAERDGTVRVIVTLSLDTTPEGDLPPEERDAQREKIADEQKALLADLGDTEFSDVSTFVAVPLVALRLSPEALGALRKSQRVTAVEEDRPVGPSQSG